jgi:uncharacterized protein YjbI with pentapeptide repeats
MSDARPLPGQGFRALTARWTKERVERLLELLHQGDREALAGWLATEVPKAPFDRDSPDFLDLKGLNFDALDYRVDLGRVKFEKLNLKFSSFRDVNFKGATFTQCDLALSRMTDVYLRDVKLVQSDLYGVSFRDCDMLGIKLERTKLTAASFQGCRINIQDFPKPLEEENKGRFDYARDIYKALRLDLQSAGDMVGAGEASYRQLTAARKNDFSKKRYGSWTISILLDLLWGYGERPVRLLISSVVLCLLCGVGLYLLGIGSGGLCFSAETSYSELEKFGLSLYLSFVSFTTLGYGDFSPCTPMSRLLAISEAFFGAFIMGLFVTANLKRFTGGIAG